MYITYICNAVTCNSAYKVEFLGTEEIAST